LAAEASSDQATEGEREFRVAEQAGLDTRGFHIALTLDVRGAVPPDGHWLTAWAALGARHDALRTRFQEDESGVLRRIAPAESTGIFEIGTTADRAAALDNIRARQSEPFAMDAPPLWRAGLTRVAGNEEALFWLVLHHSIGDGLSLGVLVEELTAILHGRTLPALEGSPARSAALAEAYPDSEARRNDAAHWRGVLAGMPDAFDEWPLDFPRPAMRSAKSAKGTHTHRIRLDAATADALRRFAQRNGASLHALMLTVLAQEARRRTGRSDFLLGTAASTRETAAEARVVGYYVNMLPVPCRLRRGQSVEQVLAATQRSLGDGLRRSRYPFARIYQDLRRDHPSAIHPGRYPLFDLAVTENPAVGDTDTDTPAFRFAAVETLTGEGVH
jgi:hypothetical protein